MRFKQFIREGLKTKPFSTPISEEEAKAWINKHARVFAKHLIEKTINPIWRGQTSVRDWELGDTSKFKRTASSTANIVNMFVSMSDQWKEYPRRDQAFICTTSLRDASGYGAGNASIVIPSDNSRVGICPKFDFWESFKTLDDTFGMNVDEFNRFLQDVANEPLSQVSETELKSQLDDVTYKSLQQKINGGWVPPGSHDLMEYMIDEMKSKNWTLYEFVNHVLDPDSSHFKATTASQLEDVGPRNELWVDGQVLFIDFGDDGNELEWLKNAI